LKLAPGVDRSQFLIDKFGRSGMEMAAIMQLGGDKIKEMNAGISQSMIIDDQKAASILRTKQALDEYNDALSGMRYEVAGKLLEIFAAMPQPLKDVTLTLGAVGQSGLLQQLANMSILLGNMGKFAGVGSVLTSIGTGAKALAVGTYAALGPVGALAAALGLLLVVIDKFGPQALNTLKMLDVLATNAVFGGDKAATVYSQNFGGTRASGGRVSRGSSYIVGENRPELFVPDSNGSIIPSASGGGGMNVFNLTYAPAVSTASRLEVQSVLSPFISDIMRTMGGR